MFSSWDYGEKLKSDNPTLLLAYGNPLREDDGIAPFLAESLQKDSINIDIVIAHQLLPEHAELISRYQQVLFADARIGTRIGYVEVHPLDNDKESLQNTMTHHFDPTMLLRSAFLLYQQKPKAWCFNIESHHFDHSDSLSAPMKQQFEEIKGKLQKTIQGLLTN